MMLKRTTLPIFIGIATTGAALAQEEADGGPWSTNALVYCRRQTITSSGGGAEELYVKETGPQTSPAVPYSAAPGNQEVPDYRVSTMFDQQIRAFVDIDAISTGNDFFTLNAQGQIDPTLDDRWISLQASVVHDANAGLPESVLNQRATSGKNVGGDVYSYFFPGVSNIEGELIDNVYLAQSSTDNGFGDAPDGFDALDFQLPMIVASDPPPVTDPIVQFRNRFYFSLSHESAVQLRAQMSGSNPMRFPFNGAGMTTAQITGSHIYKMTWFWNGANYAWSPAVVVCTPAELGLDTENSSVNHDIDALAMDAGTLQFPEPHFLFSVRGVYTDANAVGYHDQVEVASRSIAGGTFARSTARANDNDKVSLKLKLRSADNVNGLCGLDPDIVGAPTFGFSPLFATPVETETNGTAIHLSAGLQTLSSDPAPSKLFVTMSGWGDAGPCTGPATIVCIAYDPITWSPTVIPLWSGTRTASQDRLTISVPCDPAALSGYFLSIQGFFTFNMNAPDAETYELVMRF